MPILALLPISSSLWKTISVQINSPTAHLEGTSLALALKTKTLNLDVNLRMWKLKLWRNGKHKVKVFRRFGKSFYLSHDERTASKTMNVKPSTASDRKPTVRTSQRTDGRVRRRWKMSERQGSAQTRSVIRVFLFKILLISVNLSWTRVE